MTILLITLTDSCCQYDLRVHVCFINMQFLKKRYAQKIYLFINRCSHIHESDIWWIIDYFEAILPHFTIFIHCWKPMVSLAEAYWPYSLIIFFLMNYSQSTNEEAERFNTWRYKNKIDLPDVQIFFCITMHAYSVF